MAKLVDERTGEPIDPYGDRGFEEAARLWTKVSWQRRLPYEPTWLGVPIIQAAEDIVMMQEVIYRTRPDAIIECGLAHGGSAVFYASLLELLGKGRVVGVDVEIRKYNEVALRAHPMSKRIEMVLGSSTDPKTLDRVRSLLGPEDRVLVTLDSDHSYAHVKEELRLYAPLVSRDSYLVVFDGSMPLLADTPRGKPAWTEDNPLRAIEEFLVEHPEFAVDPHYNRLKVTHCPRGFLRRT